MERYFEQPLETKLKDTRKETGFQIGATPPETEDPRCSYDPACQEIISRKPHEIVGADPKWRYFWKMGQTGNVCPEGFPQWQEVMEDWASSMHHAVSQVASMLSIGLGYESKFIPELCKDGDHLLAPTGSDLKSIQKGTVLAGFHYDLNLLTIHGKSRFPGLRVWLRDGSVMEVKVPDGCLLVQAGKQLEWLAGGKILAGYHEVAVLESTIQAVSKAKSENHSLWRVSSTFFYHYGHQRLLKPFDEDIPVEFAEKYPPMSTKEYIRKELEGISLLKK